MLPNGRARGLPLNDEGLEKYNTGTTFAFDNDLFTPGGLDDDYTGGAAVTFSGRRAAEWKLSLDPLIDWFEPAFFDDSLDDTYLHSMQIGLIAFTPDDLNNDLVIPDDRPYASLVFASNSRTSISSPTAPVDTTRVTVGVLGLGLAGEIQTFIHEERNLDEVPQGWDHQISDGGEPTFRIAWSRQSLLSSNFQADEREYELKLTRELSVGYQTEASLTFSARWGRINTPWWSFTPDRADYVAQPAPVIGTAFRENTRELYFWFGAKARARVYNAFLQGQFRDSDLSFDYSDIEPVLIEAWAGVTWQFTDTLRLSYTIRYQSAELKFGTGNRDLVWGGLILSVDR